MKISRALWTRQSGWASQLSTLAAPADAELALVFGATALLKDDAAALADIRRTYPNAYICGCSTSGEIAGSHVLDDAITVTAIKFASTKFRAVDTLVTGPQESIAAGRRLASALPHEGLNPAFVLSDGLS